MDIKKKITENLQLILAFAAVAGVVVGVLNFFILTTVTPIEKRVMALESFQKDSMPIFTSARSTETKVGIMYDDIKDIKSFLKIR